MSVKRILGGKDMVFYKIDAVSEDFEEKFELSNRRAQRNFAEELAEKSETLYRKSKGNCFAFVTNIRDDKVSFGMLIRVNGDEKNWFEKYEKLLPFKLKNIDFEEVTFRNILSTLKNACHTSYIFDDEHILDDFEINDISGYGSIAYGENIIEDALSKEAVFKIAEQNLVSGTLTPELNRIYSENSPRKFKGHPVHYIVKNDSNDSRKEIYRTLLAALYNNNRIQNKRYCFIDFDSDSRVNTKSLETHYKINVGGAIVIRYETDVDCTGEYNSRGCDVISKICEVANKYKNNVLTVICLPVASTKIKEEFLLHFGSTAFIELYEDVVFKDQAQEYLKYRAKQVKIKSDKKLTSLSDDMNKGYTATELNRIFDEWYNQKLRSTVYPEYKEAIAAKAKVKNDKPKGSAYERLQALVGLSEAKKVMDQALNFYKAQKLFADRGFTDDHPAMHMIFTGNPGTAKTTVARLFAQIMKENGLLSKGDLYEVGRADIVGQYVGQTAPLVQKAFKKAKGGVLFIDEAYSLVDERDGLYGDEAINTIVQEMENNRKDMVVIFAGYPDKMEGFLNKNPGLRSRIAFHIPFEDYTSEELCDIARLIASDKGVKLSDDAMKKLENIFESVVFTEDFGNGRFVRNIIEKAKMTQAGRLVSMDLSEITDEDIVTLCETDIEEPEITPNKQLQRIGFAV